MFSFDHIRQEDYCYYWEYSLIISAKELVYQINLFNLYPSEFKWALLYHVDTMGNKRNRYQHDLTRSLKTVYWTL